ncbi:hypothetical protein LCGC14_0249770 [marine sediment metagenome]|uniref:Helicase ATP-binding domain-containing protein n=1 Tax=marine sediment metagenome TaxID=412755 RepID=A0A0F9U9W0_9ZZZZ
MTELFPYQKEDVLQMERFNGRILNASQMGLGKTLVTLTYLQQHPEALPAVVVCPSSVKYVWEHEALTHIQMHSQVLEGQKPPQNGDHLFSNPGKLIILNYDILQYWVAWLRKLKPQTLILDECHKVKSRTTKVTKAAKSLSRSIPNMFALSGTPLTNRPAELWPTLNMLRPDLYPAFWPFGIKHCAGKKSYWGWEFKGATNVKELHDKLTKQLMIRRRKKDVLDLPPKVRQTIPCELSDRTEYEEASNDLIGWLRKNNPRKAGESKMMAMVRLGYLLRLAARLKLKSVVRWINRFHLESEDEKLIVFAHHKGMIRVIKKRCRAKSVVIDGSVAGQRRKAMADQFQQDKKTRLLIGNIQAAGVGLTLTAASTVAFAELDWVPGNMLQAEDRPHRIGQTKTVWIYYLVAGDTVEEKLCKVLQEKQKIITRILDGDLGDGKEFDVFNELLGLLGV